MNWTKRILVTLTLSFGIAIGLSLFTQLEARNGGLYQSVFLNSARMLNDQNIVDFVSKFQLHLRIRKVEINHSIVSIDLSLNAAASKTDILHDMYEIPELIFTHTSNINQVFVRVLDMNNGINRQSGASLMAALDARRENWMPDSSKTTPDVADELSRYIESHYHVTYTNKFNERFGSTY
jgi:hypothetical protein